MRALFLLSCPLRTGHLVLLGVPRASKRFVASTAGDKVPSPGTRSLQATGTGAPSPGRAEQGEAGEGWALSGKMAFALVGSSASRSVSLIQ
jgi:hypothetical protein